MCHLIPKQPKNQAVKTINARTSKSQTRRDNGQDRRINTLTAQLNASLSQLKAARTRNDVSRSILDINRPLTEKELAFVPSLINAKAGNLTQDSPLIEKVMRTRLDPAHALRYCRGVSSPQRSYTHSSKGTFTVVTVAGNNTWVISLPFLECPYMVSTDSGNTWTGKWGDNIANIFDRVNVAKAEASRTIGKSMTPINITTPDNKVDLCYALRIDPAFNLYDKCDSKYWYDGAAQVNITYENAATARTKIVNQKVLQNIPQDFNAVSSIAVKCKSGAYIVNNILDDDFRTYQVISDRSGMGTADYPPTNTTNNSILRIGYIGGIAENGSAVVTAGAANGGMAADARLTVSKLMNTDVTAFYIPANAQPQTYQFETYEHTQFITSDMTLLNSEADDPYDIPEIDGLLRRANAEISGIYPPEYNDWGAVWSYLKKKVSDAAQAVGSFYKTNAKVLKPALSLIPGASTALDLVEKYI